MKTLEKYLIEKSGRDHEDWSAILKMVKDVDSIVKKTDKEVLDSKEVGEKIYDIWGALVRFRGIIRR
jgi:hypothetical protein